MRVAAIDGRLCLGTDRGWVDVAVSSGRRFDADPQAAYDRWAEFTQWASAYSPNGESAMVRGEFGAPVPRPQQVFGAGLNYADHPGEAELELPTAPLIFAKYPSCISGPAEPLVVSTDSLDWEVELVVVIGASSRNVPANEAWTAMVGLTVGQDVSDRTLQWSGGATPQFSLGKSGPGFGPIGPVLVTPDELGDRGDLAIECRLNGEVVQSSCTRHPPRYLAGGDELVSTIEGIGEFTTRVTAA